MLESQKEAISRYRRKLRAEGRLKTILVEFQDADMDLYEHIRKQPTMAGYIKRLVREDMGR